MNLKGLDERVLAEIKGHGLLFPGDRVVVGVSGGPDSVMLLHWLYRYQKRWDLSLLAVHLNHQLRPEADEEEDYVARLCRQWDIPCLTFRRDVGRWARERKLSIQVAARQCRYELFAQVARERGFNKIALAHHGDDQVETVMLRLVRGAGPGGLAGIPVKRRLAPDVEVIRPLLALSKGEIEAYCRRFDLKPRLDPSNLKDDYARNWVRHHLLPKMKELNPNLVQAVYQLTQLLAEDVRYLDRQAEEALQRLKIIRQPDLIRVQRKPLAELPPPLQRRVIQLLLSYLLDFGRLEKTHIDAVGHLIAREAGQQEVHLPDHIVVRRQYQDLLFYRQPPAGSRREEEREGYAFFLPTPGTYTFEGLPFTLTLTEEPSPATTKGQGQGDGGRKAGSVYVASFDKAQLALPLMVRSRQPGDRIQPLGLEGHSKVKEIFINHKVPRSVRAIYPLVADQKGLLWLPGLVRSERAKLTDETEAVYTLSIEFREGFLCWKTSKKC